MTVNPAGLSLSEPPRRLEIAAPLAPAKVRLRPLIRSLAYLVPFLVTGALYEVLRGVFQHHGSVHVGDLAALEARLFSVSTAQGPRPLSELIARQTNVWFDVWCGATYFLFLMESIAVTIYLSFRARSQALQLSVGFLVVNLLGWLVWVCYPAAPPWYADEYGLHATGTNVVSSAAGLLRFDALLGVPLSSTFYAQSADVFGAVPSLHVAYATLVALVVAPLGGWLRLAALAFALSMAFSAVYLRHHYLIDVVAGALLAVVVVLGMRVARRLAARGSLLAQLQGGSRGGPR